MEAAAWHALPATEVVERLGTTPDGLDDAGARVRLAEVGENALPEARARPWVALVVDQVRSPLVLLLFLAAAIALLLGERSDALVILVVVALNAVVGVVQEGRAERSLEALRQLADLQARVVRGGRELLVSARELVPGDVLRLAAGDLVPADARVLEGAALEVAEAALTGESLPVPKAPGEVAEDTALPDRRSMVHAGTHVTAGRASAVVVATGGATEIGHIAALTTGARDVPTPLERRIDRFGRVIGLGALVVCGLVLLIGSLRGLPWSELLMVALGQMVSMVPEGLPVAMTVALAVGVQRMARRGAIVRQLSAVETLGSTTVICTDKTGTLTRNEMTVTAVRLPGGARATLTGVGYAPEGRIVADDGHERRVVDVLAAAALCCDARLAPPAGDEGWRILGDPTEGALLVAAAKAGLEPEVLRSDRPRRAEIPFDSDLGMMATGHDGLVVVKGAPEAVLELCGARRLPGGDAPLDPAARAEERRAADEMAAEALRVLAVATVEGPLEPAGGFAALRGRAVLLGLVGQMDPPRDEVRAAVSAAVAAGIRPVMVTGDHRVTGHAIAEALGIAREGDRVVDGRELDQVTDEELTRDIDTIPVFARVHPAQKLRIVEAWQRRGHVVAMTGDGVNDAPALARADVGLAMGRTGTEVAKQASRMVITDDNFATIVAAIEEGRVVYANLKKVVLYLVSTSLAEVLVLLLALALGFPPPLAAVQILWINLVTEGVVTVNLVLEPAEGDEMTRPPTDPKEPLLTRALTRRMALMIPSIALVTFGWFAVRARAGVPFEQVRSEAFTLMAACAWWNVLSCRSATVSAFELPILRNRWLTGGLLLGVALQVAVIYVRPLGDVFHTVALEPWEFLALPVIAALVLVPEEVRKALARGRSARAERGPGSGAIGGCGAASGLSSDRSHEGHEGGAKDRLSLSPKRGRGRGEGARR